MSYFIIIFQGPFTINKIQLTLRLFINQMNKSHKDSIIVDTKISFFFKNICVIKNKSFELYLLFIF